MLTPFEWHALTALQNTGYCKKLPPSAVGHTLWEKSDHETRKQRPSQQGLALFAGKFLRSLSGKELAGWSDGWYITQAGREMLADRPTAQGAGDLPAIERHLAATPAKTEG